MDTLAHMLDLGWIIYTSKHSCVYSFIRWEKKEKKERAWASTFAQCLCCLSLTKLSPATGGNRLYTVQFPFWTPPQFFSEVVISQDFCSAPCWFIYMRRREQTICFSPKGMKMWPCFCYGMELSFVPTSWWTVLNPANTFWGSISLRPPHYQVVLQQKQ